MQVTWWIPSIFMRRPYLGAEAGFHQVQLVLDLAQRVARNCPLIADSPELATLRLDGRAAHLAVEPDRVVAWLVLRAGSVGGQRHLVRLANAPQDVLRHLAVTR